MFEKTKPYIAMISLQFGYAGMNVITKVSLNHGMSHYVLVVYRHAFATLSIAPFALILERYSPNKIERFHSAKLLASVCTDQSVFVFLLQEGEAKDDMVGFLANIRLGTSWVSSHFCIS
jgi:hypothetical protein